MYEDYLIHYGRLGMRWGQHIFGKDRPSGERRKAKTKKPSLRKRRAYAIAVKRQLEAERQKQKILSNPKLLYKNRDKFTKAEIDAAMKKIQWDRQLKQLSDSEISTGKRFIDGYIKTAATASKVINTTKTLNKATGGFLFKYIDEELNKNSSIYSEIRKQVNDVLKDSNDNSK